MGSIMTTEILIGNQKYKSTLRVGVKDIAENKFVSYDYYTNRKYSNRVAFPINGSTSTSEWTYSAECKQMIEWCQNNLSEWTMYRGVFYMKPEDLPVFLLRWA